MPPRMTTTPPSPSRAPAQQLRGLQRVAVACVFGLTGACGDRAPRALWPEPPPPTLAKPIGIEDPTTLHATDSGPGGRAEPEADVERARAERAAVVRAKLPHAATPTDSTGAPAQDAGSSTTG